MLTSARAVILGWELMWPDRIQWYNYSRNPVSVTVGSLDSDRQVPAIGHPTSAGSRYHCIWGGILTKPNPRKCAYQRSTLQCIGYVGRAPRRPHASIELRCSLLSTQVDKTCRVQVGHLTKRPPISLARYLISPILVASRGRLSGCGANMAEVLVLDLSGYMTGSL